jgi:YegS/Rv2252/BmrU family lipid kinase
MPASSAVSTRKLFVILNPGSGTFSAEAVHEALERHFSCGDGTCHVHQLTDADDLAALARSAAGRGVEAVVAAGGDGTVSAVAGGLVGSGVPLGILPLGTANVLARELGIPVDLDGACALLAADFATTPVDAMKVRDRYIFTQVGVGIDAMMIRDTKTEHKKRFGRVAYLWTGLTRMVGFQPRRFLLTVDGREVRTKASQVLVANSGTLGQPPLTWGPGIRPDDGRVDLCVVRAATLWHYLRITWNVVRRSHRDDPKLRYYPVARSVTIASRRPLPVQGDGEVLGETPVEVAVVAGAIRVVVPR